MTRRLARIVCAAMVTSSVAVSISRAQETLLPGSNWGLAPTVAAWHFNSAVAQTVGGVTDVLQLAVPLRIRARIGSDWNVDVSGAVSSSILRADSAAANTRTITLNGLSDIRVRLNGPLFGDGLAFTGGVNLPAGLTKLSSDQTSVLQTVASPALQMPIGVLGLGLGGTAGIVGARQAGAWTLAAGASVEERAQYTPIEIALAGTAADTRLTPGAALHFTAGADTPLGDQRLDLLFVADVYSRDRLTSGNGSGAASVSTYTLGPQLSATARLDLAANSWREASANLSIHYRSGFSDASGATVPGSSGSYIDASFSGIRGRATGNGFIFELDAHQDSRLSFTTSLVGAGATVAGVTVGVDMPGAFATARLLFHGQYGTFDTGTTKSTGFGASLSYVFAARGAR